MPDVLEKTPEQIKLEKSLQQVIKPGTPEEEKDEQFMFKMHIKRGPTSTDLFFSLKGKRSKIQREAEESGRKYCERFRLRFIWVELFLVDINAVPREEKPEDN